MNENEILIAHKKDVTLIVDGGFEGAERTSQYFVSDENKAVKKMGG